jgi:hypothetical protein
LLRVKVRLRVRIKVRVRARVRVRVKVRVGVKVRTRVEVKVRVRVKVRVGSTSNPQIGVQFSNIWPFFTFSNRRPMTSLTYTSNDVTPVRECL